jgi:putative transposase
VGVRKACETLSVSRATLYRRRRPNPAPSKPRQNHRALSQAEETAVLALLNSEAYVDQSPYQVYAHLLDQGNHLCSVRTMYRILQKDTATRERRNQLSHPTYTKPELLAVTPNQVWSWDITKLKGPEKWTYYYLYVIMDIYSRYIVGWMLAERESGSLARQLISETIAKETIQPDQLIIHSDRGAAMRSLTVAQLYAALGVTKSYSRPHVSNDNPFSESLFKTVKYRPEFPERFGSLQDGLSHCRAFFRWYNHEHYHSGIGFLTPSTLHQGRAEATIRARNRTLELAFERNPHRFVKGKPQAKRLPTAVWINPPNSSAIDQKGAPDAWAPEAPRHAPLTHPRSSYPSIGCVPAEPTSVSLDEGKITRLEDIEHLSHA